MKYVAFFRNVNLGQRGSPTRPQLEAAFADAGAAGARSFQTNGTVVFEAVDDTRANGITAEAVTRLAALMALREPAYAVPLAHLAELVAAGPFTGFEAPDVHERAATFGPPAAFAALRPPLLSPRGDVALIRVTPYVALSVCRALMSSPGAATPFLERLLGVPVTTRSWTTIVRLVKKYAARGS